MTTYIADLQARLDARAEKRRREWWERYLKGVIPFRGVDMSGIRAAVREWFDDNDLVKLPRDERINLAWELLRRKLAEDKLAGILLMQEVLLPARDIDWPTDLAAIVSLFDEGHIADWSTCDWLCVRVLGPLADQQGEQCAREIASWSTTANLWRRRAAAPPRRRRRIRQHCTPRSRALPGLPAHAPQRMQRHSTQHGTFRPDRYGLGPARDIEGRAGCRRRLRRGARERHVPRRSALRHRKTE